MKISSEKRLTFSNIILKRWLLKVGPVRRKTILTKIKEDIFRLRSSSSTTRKGFLQLFSHPVIPIRRGTATQHVKYRRPYTGEENCHSVISNQDIRCSYDDNNNVKIPALPDIDNSKPPSMGPSNSGVGSQIGCIKQRLSCPTSPPSKETGKKISLENATEKKDRRNSRHESQGTRRRDSRKKSRDPDREKRLRRRKTPGENPNNIPWKLSKIDPNFLSKPRDKLRWIETEKKRKKRNEMMRKRDRRLFVKFIDLFGEDSDKDVGYCTLLAAVRIPDLEQRTITESAAASSAEKSVTPPLDVVAVTDVEVSDKPLEQPLKFSVFLEKKKRRISSSGSSDETVVSQRRKSKKRSRLTRARNTAADLRTFSDETSSDASSDPEDRSYRPSHFTSRHAHRSIFRDRSTRRSALCPSNKYTTAASPEHKNRVNISTDRSSIDSVAATELLCEKNSLGNEPDSGLYSDISSANASNSESAATSRQASVTREESGPISAATSSCNVGYTDAENGESATAGDKDAGNPSGPITPTIAAVPPISDLKPLSEDFQALDSIKTSPSRPAQTSNADPKQTLTKVETKSSDRLLGALDKIFLSLLSRRRINERQQSASRLAIKRNQQEEVLKAEREKESVLADFRDEILYLLQKLGKWDRVFCFVSEGLDHRTPVGVEHFTKTEMRHAMLEARLKVECEEVKVELPTDKEEEEKKEFDPLIERVICTIDLTTDEPEKNTEWDIGDSRTDPVQPNSREADDDVKLELINDCSISEESEKPKCDLNANEIPLTVPSIAEVKTISRQQFETIGEKPSLLTPEEDPCLMCSKTSHVACGQCFKASYCSKQCQETHWRQEHHATCVPRLVPVPENIVK